MGLRPADLIAPAMSAVGGMVLLGWWLAGGPPNDMRLRVPGLDRAENETRTADRPVSIPVPGTPVKGSGTVGTSSGSWPGFRGPARDGIAGPGVRLAHSWPADGPPVLWQLTLGEGYAGAAISDGRVFVLDYDEQAQADTLRCLSLDDGREIWHNGYAVEVTRNHGMSRTIPAIDGSYVVTLGPQCDVACWDAATGQCRWLVDLVAEYGTRVPRWYAGQCPLIDQGRVIVAPCGSQLLVALDCTTGTVIWKSPNPRGWEMTHSSIMPMELPNRRAYVYWASGGLVGVSADDGSLLWESDCWPSQFATATSPLVLPGSRIFLCSGYGSRVGGMMLELRDTAGGMSVATQYELAPNQFNAEQQTPIFFQGHIFGVRKHGGGQLVCLDLEGRECWNSGEDRFGLGPFTAADGLLFAMNDTGRLTLVELTPDAYRPLGHCQVFRDGLDAWGPIALASGRLIARDMTRMACLDVAEHGGDH